MATMVSPQQVTLSLVANDIGDDGAAAVARACGGGRSSIKRLILNSNGIGDDGAWAFVAALGSGRCPVRGHRRAHPPHLRARSATARTARAALPRRGLIL